MQGLGIVVQHLPAPGSFAAAPHPVIAALAARLLATARTHSWQELARLLQAVAGDAAAEAAAQSDPGTATCPTDTLMADASPESSLPEGGEPSTPPSPAAAKGCPLSTASEAGSSSDIEMVAAADPDVPSSSCSEFAKIGGDYAKWVAQQLRFAPGGGGGSLRMCVAMLGAATGATLVLRRVLGEVQ
jgi:hypothetical protein